MLFWLVVAVSVYLAIGVIVFVFMLLESRPGGAIVDPKGFTAKNLGFDTRSGKIQITNWKFFLVTSVVSILVSPIYLVVAFVKGD